MISNEEIDDLLNRFDTLTPEEESKLDKFMEEFQQTEHGKALTDVLSILADIPPDELESKR